MGFEPVSFQTVSHTSLYAVVRMTSRRCTGKHCRGSVRLSECFITETNGVWYFYASLGGQISEWDSVCTVMSDWECWGITTAPSSQEASKSSVLQGVQSSQGHIVQESELRPRRRSKGRRLWALISFTFPQGNWYMYHTRRSSISAEKKKSHSS